VRSRTRQHRNQPEDDLLKGLLQLAGEVMLLGGEW
jgi:hypothetical protein